MLNLSNMNIKSISIICLMLWFSKDIFAQQRNMMQEEVIKVSGITDDSQIYSLTPNQKQITRSYFDGLGRTIQTNAVKASPLQKDIIQSYKYDNLGRQTTDYLPYAGSDGSGNFHASATTEQLAFYSNGTGDKVADDSSPFKQAIFENSPLQRLLQEGSVGNNFQPGQHNKSVSYRQNTSADAVINWSAAGVNVGVYAVGTLSATIFTDEAGKQSLLFKDVAGKTVLKRELINEVIGGVTETKLDTYYIYNEAGSLIWIVPPKAVAIMKAASNWALTQTTVSNLLFSYLYDDRGRLVEKKVPESGTIYFIYDPLDRLVLLQDANLRLTNKWNYIKYDVKNRAISQGVYLDATRTTRTTMQTYVSGLNYSVTYYEKRSTAAATRYYTNLVFPTTGITPLAYGYYENYDINQDGTADYGYQAQGLTGEASPTSNTRGVLTAVSKRSIGAGLADIWLTNVIFYDKKGNVIQTRSNNQITAAVSDTRTNVLDFIGKATQVKTVKVTGSTTTTVLSKYAYDHSSRLKTIDDAYNGSTPIRIAAYEYNELGQLVDKKLHSVNSGSSYLQSVDFRYNIRGSLISINNGTLTSDTKNDDLNDVFGMEVLYDVKDTQLNNTSYYDGSISALKWRAITPSATNPNQKAYRFDYNTQKQLKNALYSNKTVAATTWINDGAFDEKSIAYDHNGNISVLKRNALLSGTISEVDNLTYTYIGNLLSNVADGTGGNYATVGFKNPTASTAVYTYDAAGNMITDPKKGLALSYNLLNKTDKITISTSVGRYITYTYDGSGILLRKQAFDNNVIQKTTDYIDGFVYENNVLAYFGMAEGRVRNTGAALKPEYMIADQQGNVRVSFEDNAGAAVVRQENGYYPFGLIMPGGTIPSAPNKNLYNAGSEWQNDFADMPDLYNTFYRNYDAALGRFIAVDPRADESNGVSPFQYALNNPLMFNDPLGDKQQMDWPTAARLFIERGRYTTRFSRDGVTFTAIGSTTGGSSGATWAGGIDEGSIGVSYMNKFGAWGRSDFAKSYGDAVARYSIVDRFPGGEFDFGREGYVTVNSLYNEPGFTLLGLQSTSFRVPGTNVTSIGEGIADRIWNSAMARYLVPDFISIGGGGTAISGGGVGISFQASWVLRGRNASLRPAFTMTQSAGIGYSMDLTLNIGSARYLGPVADINRGMLVTNSFQDNQVTMWGSMGVAAGGKVGITGEYTNTPNGWGIIGSSINIGGGLPAGLVPGNAAGGVSNTYMLHDFYK